MSFSSRFTVSGGGGRESETNRNPSPSSSSSNRHPPIKSDRSMETHQPELRSNIGVSGKTTSEIGNQKLTKLLLHVSIQRSLGPVQVLTSPEKTVDELIKEALQIYVKEKRRPLLTETDPQCFELHFSQFSFESLNREEKLISLGSRNFFLCLKPTVTMTNTVASSSSLTCSNEANKKLQDHNKSYLVWTRFMDFLL